MIGAGPAYDGRAKLRALEHLARKYDRLVELRAAREALEARGIARFDPTTSRARKVEFGRIARRHPGALRELDCLPADALRARGERVRAALERCRAGQAHDDPFVALILDFHTTLRMALAARRFVAVRGPAAADRLAQRLERIAATGAAMPFGPGEARAWIRLVSRPPGGRLLDLVWRELEGRHARQRADLEAQLFSI